MAGQCLDSSHRRKIPDDDSVFGVAVGTNELITVFAEHQVTHLRLSLHALKFLAVDCVPEANAAVCCAASTCKQAFLMR